MARTERVFANEIVAGNVIVCASGDSITVETIVREEGDDLISFEGTLTSHSYTGNTGSDNNWYNAFWDEQVTILVRA